MNVHIYILNICKLRMKNVHSCKEHTQNAQCHNKQNELNSYQPKRNAQLGHHKNEKKHIYYIEIRNIFGLSFVNK